MTERIDAKEGITLGRHYDDETKRAGNKVVYEGERHCCCLVRTEPARERGS